jgi:hypothetical protein
MTATFKKQEVEEEEFSNSNFLRFNKSGEATGLKKPRWGFFGASLTKKMRWKKIGFFAPCVSN